MLAGLSLSNPHNNLILRVTSAFYLIPYNTR